METRLYKVSDYANLKGWWDKHWGSAPAVQALPQSGLIVEKDGRDVAAGWVYLDTTSPTAFLAWMVANPNNTAKQSMEAITYLIGGLVELARSQGRVNIIAQCPSGALSRLFQSCGFVLRDKDVNHLTMEVNQ